MNPDISSRGGSELVPGARVRDRDTENQALAIVLQCHDVPAKHYLLITPDAILTVADINPRHPAESPVVTVAFVEDLAEEIERWSECSVEQLRQLTDDEGIPEVPIPAARLRVVRDADGNAVGKGTQSHSGTETKLIISSTSHSDTSGAKQVGETTVEDSNSDTDELDQEAQPDTGQDTRTDSGDWSPFRTALELYDEQEEP